MDAIKRKVELMEELKLKLGPEPSELHEACLFLINKIVDLEWKVEVLQGACLGPK